MGEGGASGSEDAMAMTFDVPVVVVFPNVRVSSCSESKYSSHGVSRSPCQYQEVADSDIELKHNFKAHIYVYMHDTRKYYLYIHG